MQFLKIEETRSVMNACVRACVRVYMPVNLKKCVFSLCSCKYMRTLSSCVCLVVCFVIVGSSYMNNNLPWCTRFDSFVCTDVWCSSQTHLDYM